MPGLGIVRDILRETLGTYWTLVKTIVPVMLLTRLAMQFGLVEAISPAFGPIMAALGLPPELGVAWLTGILVGFWGGAVALFAVVPVEALTSAQVTVFLGLLLVAHGLPAEQRIIQTAGPGFAVTVLLRLVGGFLYALILHLVFRTTGWLDTPASPDWVPTTTAADWSTYLLKAAEGLGWMFVILLALVMGMRLLEAVGLTARIAALLAPALRVCGIGPSAGPITMVGLLLGISYGGGLIKREAEAGRVGPRDLFLASILMGFAHSLIEDTVVVIALGGDPVSLLVGRVVFAIAAVAVLARLLATISDRAFFRYLFRPPRAGVTAPSGTP